MNNIIIDYEFSLGLRNQVVADTINLSTVKLIIDGKELDLHSLLLNNKIYEFKKFHGDMNAPYDVG